MVWGDRLWWRQEKTSTSKTFTARWSSKCSATTNSFVRSKENLLTNTSSWWLQKTIQTSIPSLCSLSIMRRSFAVTCAQDQLSTGARTNRSPSESKWFLSSQVVASTVRSLLHNHQTSTLHPRFISQWSLEFHQEHQEVNDTAVEVVTE